MYISMNWINDYVDLSGMDTEEIVKRFNLSTAEIEGYEVKGEKIQNVVFGKILEVNDHPESTHLHVLKVDVGDEVLQIVCGAPNVRVGLRGVLAPVGCKLPGMKKPMSQRTVAGVESFGMMCSAAELGLSGDDKNIIELNPEYKIGEEYK